MAAAKRKADAQDPEHRAKRLRPASSTSATPSALPADDFDFPRGGQSNVPQPEIPPEHAGPESVAEPSIFATKAPSHKRTSKRSLSTADNKKSTFNGRRIEKMNYKRLTDGIKILCRVVSIYPLGLVVSLPDQLIGHVPITSVSSEYSNLLENEEQSDEEMENGDSLPDLSDLFHCGQYLRAVVTAVHPHGSTDAPRGRLASVMEKASQRVELSIAPHLVNAGVSTIDLRPGFALTASVRSVEDYGLILDVGLQDVSGFLPFSQDPTAKTLRTGQLVDVVISKVGDNKRTCEVTTQFSKIQHALLSEISTVSSILPGTLVDSLVTAVAPNGINLQLLGYFDGTVDLIHLPHSYNINVGDKVKARILYNITSGSAPSFALSLAPHILQLKQNRFSADSTAVTSEELFPVGTTIKAASIVRVEPDHGLTLELENGIRGFVHISQVSDDHIPALSSSSGKWKVGSVHTSRVIGHFSMDALLQLSMKESVLQQRFLRVDEVAAGEIVTGTVKKLTPSAVFLSISGNVDGVIWPNHYADIQLKHPEKRFREGTTMKCRILVVDPERRRIVLTAKKSLVNSSLPIVSNLDEVKVGATTLGSICKVTDKSIIVEFYNNLRALVPAQEINDSFRAVDYPVGKPVKAVILSFDRSTGRIIASIKQASSSQIAPNLSSFDDVQIGDRVIATVQDIHADNVVLNLKPSSIRALLSLKNLANARSCTVSQLRDSLHVGEPLSDLVIVSKSHEKGLVIVANQPKGKAAVTLNGTQSLSIESIRVGQSVTGRAVRHSARGTHLKFSSHVHGTLHPTDVHDDFSQAVIHPPIGMVLTGVVIEVDRDKKHLTLSTRISRMQPDTVSNTDIKDKEVTRLDVLRVGDKIRGFVKNVSEHGLFVSVARHVDARVQIKELFDEYVKDWRSRFEVHQLVAGRIIGIDTKRMQVEMTLRAGERTIGMETNGITLKDLALGQKLVGHVKKVEDYGIFINVEGSKLTGLCHKSEISDNPSADVALALRSFHENDRVKAVVLAIDEDKRRLSLSIKPSHFTDDMGPEEEDNNDIGSSGQHISDTDTEGGHEGEDVSEDDTENGEIGNDGLMNLDTTTLHALSLQSAKPQESSDSFRRTLDIDEGFHWTKPDELSWSQGDEDSESSPVTVLSNKNKRKVIEEDVTATLQAKTPQSVADFERVLLSSPNSSYLWIQYMSFQLQLYEVDRARDIAKRALQSINFREEQEKLNVWIALLNLENTYGTDETLESTFREATRHNDSKTVHLRLSALLDESGKVKQAEEQYQRTCRKFGLSSKVWTSFAEHYLRRGDFESSRRLLSRSLQSLHKRKHLKTIARFAQLEYKLGEPERGKMLFEGIIDSHPKRWDIWWIYIDMEACQGDIQAIRSLVDRILSLKITNHKAKSLFKKWLELERRFGDEDGAEAVKDRARAWARTLQ